MPSSRRPISTCVARRFGRPISNGESRTSNSSGVLGDPALLALPLAQSPLSAMRIVSLLPAATEWVCIFGGQEDLVGRSHECDYPESIQDVPVVTAPTYASEGDSAAIDDAVQGQLQEGLSLYDVDLERLRALEPDLIVTQDQCEVCAVSLPEVEAQLGDWAGGTPEVVSMHPQTLKEVLDEALRLARAMEALDEAMEVIANLETGLRVLREDMEKLQNPFHVGTESL